MRSSRTLAAMYCDVGRAVVVLDADEHQQAACRCAPTHARRAPSLTVTERGRRRAGRPPSCATGSCRDRGTAATSTARPASGETAARRSSAGGLSRVSSRCRGATLPSALSIDCLTPGCSTSRSISSRLTRWRCRLRSPQAGQQQPMIGSSRFLAVQPRLVLADVDQRPDHHMRAVVGDQLGRHRLERAGEEQVQQQRLDEVVGMMAERDLGGADLRRPSGTARRGAAARTANTASASASRMSSMSSPMPVCSIRYSQPRASQVFAMRSCL